MYLTTLIEELRKNPAKYEGKKYIRGETEYKVVDGHLKYIYGNLCIYQYVERISIDDQVVEIQQEITLEEAVQAYNAGKTVTCIIKGDDAPFDKTFEFNYMTSKVVFVTITDLLKLTKGKWYIKEDT